MWVTDLAGPCTDKHTEGKVALGTPHYHHLLNRWTQNFNHKENHRNCGLIYQNGPPQLLKPMQQTSPKTNSAFNTSALSSAEIAMDAQQ